MKKLLATLAVLTSLSYGSLINGIAVTINDMPITLYDIDKEMVSKNLSKKEAVESLFDTILYEEEIRKRGISVDIFDINDYIDKLAASNNMNPLDFKSLIRQQQDYDAFTEKVKEQLIHEKLVQKIAAGNLKIATDEDMQRYYDNNLEKFSIFDTIEVVAYVSNSKQALMKIQKNPMENVENVLKQKISLKQNELNPEVKYILNSTSQGKFSVIFPQNKAYNMFYILEKKDVTKIPFADAKTRIFNEIMMGREQAYLKEYFETLKITSQVKVKR